MFLGIYLFLLCCLICWNIIVNSYWDLLYFYGINYNLFISGFIYGRTSFDCTLLYYTLQILHFYKLMLWQPWANQVCQYHCSNIICSLHVSLSHLVLLPVFQIFPSLLYILFILKQNGISMLFKLVFFSLLNIFLGLLCIKTTVPK